MAGWCCAMAASIALLVQLEVGRQGHADELQALQLRAHGVHHEAGHAAPGWWRRARRRPWPAARSVRPSRCPASGRSRRACRRGARSASLQVVDALAGIAVQRHGARAARPVRRCSAGGSRCGFSIASSLTRPGRRLDGIGVHGLHVGRAGAWTGGKAVRHGLSLISAARACACRPSPWASSRRCAQRLRARFADLDQAAALLEVVDAQRAGKARGAAGGQHVVGAGAVVAQALAGVARRGRSRRRAAAAAPSGAARCWRSPGARARCGC